MDPLDRYLRAVKPGLPLALREDILAELGENLRSQFEGRESELGRSLSNKEKKEILDAFGDPLVVAGRYQSGSGTVSFGRQLIGPELYPLYMRSLRFLLPITAGVITLIMIPLALADPAKWTELPSVLGFQVGIQFLLVTMGWMIVQSQTKKDAPVVPKPVRVSRLESILQLVITTAVLPWVQTVLGTPEYPFAPCRLAPVWHQVYVPVMIIAITGILQSVVNIFRPEWVRFRYIARMSVDFAGLAVVGYLLSAGKWVTVSDQLGGALAKRENMVVWLHWTFIGFLVAAMAILLFELVTDGVKLARTKGDPGLPAGVSSTL